MEIFGFDLAGLVYWHWWAIAGVFFVLEVLSMSFFFLWIGAAAVLVGLLLAIVPDMSWQIQLTLWALISVAGAFGWRIYRKKNPDHIKSDQPKLNRRGEQYVDRTFTLENDMSNGFGKVKVDDSIWKVECEKDLTKGTKIRVKSVEGTVLQVEEVTA